MGISIVIASGKGGTGKTTCCAAVGSFLAAHGHSTLCVDCDAALRNLDLALGLTDTALWDLADVLSGDASLEDAVIAHPAIENLYFLSAPSEKLPAELEPTAFRSLTEELRQVYDFILLDAPAGIGTGFALASRGADMGIIVATGDLSSLRDGQKAAAEMRALGIPELRLIVNRVRPRTFRKLRKTIDDVIDSVGARLLGVVSEDESVALAGNLEIPLKEYGAKYAYGQFDRISRRLTGERVPIGRI